MSRRLRFRRPPLPVLAVLAVGLAVSIGAAQLWRGSVESHERESFRTTASDVAATLATELRRDADFIATLRALVAMRPHIAPGAFDQWYRELRGRRHQVGGVASAVVSVVPASRLQAFLRRRAAAPAFRQLSGGAAGVVPAGRRSRYCLLSAGMSDLGASMLVRLAARADWCTSAIPGLARSLRAEADSGELGLTPPVLGTVFAGAAVYRPGASPRNARERRGALLGWVWSSIEIPEVIKRAIGRHHGLAVVLYHSNPGEGMRPLGGAGRAREGAIALVRHLSIDGGWRVAVHGAPIAAGLGADSQGLIVLGVGLAITTLLAALVLLLTRARAHALGLVDEKTGELRHQALHDALTGLPNRVLALDRAQQMVARARREGIPVAALYIDLDGFKHVNDTFGHAAGDELLQVVAERLNSAVRAGDTAARLGGDEFVVLVEGAHLDAGAEAVAERLLEVLRLPYSIGGRRRRLAVNASIGIAVGQRSSAEELLRDADVALYEAKAAGRDRYVVFEARMRAAVQDRLTLEMDLAEALEREQLWIVYQPTVDLRTGEVVGVEALLRWRHPTRGEMSPADFIPIAEQTGMIVTIGQWTMARACERAARWHRIGHRIGVAVNVSARQIERGGFVGEVEMALQDSGLAPGALTLEVTETTVMRDAPASARRLRALKRLGVRIAIDDFGTGYSSLAYLRQFPVDTLKIDRSFVSGMTVSREAAALVKTLIQLGGALELQTLAEGIELPEQLDALRREGCDFGQGFMFSPPLEPDALERLLRRAAAEAPLGPGAVRAAQG